MSSVNSFRDNLSDLRDEWRSLDKTIRELDLVAIFLIAIFGVEYILVNVIDTTITVSNGAMLIFPLLLAGYVYVLRSKLADEDADHKAAKREFYALVGINLFLVVLTFVYSIILNQVLLS